MDFELDPPHGVGPLRIGISRAEADAALLLLRDADSLSQSDRPGQHIFRPSGLMISISCMRDRLEAIELARPEIHADTVRFRDVDLFTLPAREVVERLRQHTPVEPAEDDPASFVAPELLLSLWRPFEADDEPLEAQGHYFTTVLLARPGYYDTPAQAAERHRSGLQP
ncbi:hypothetical protein Caci_3871 [Catenulispora acidiphila DSM 44928]|uniref:Uncharacterized protein n=1 Tax=Catenulispora acidiphila (strain DSM 44928 / JCM 14897 / NBRC 102108 / NRRL B-24433 / ID139908) TaxID=479433 RepID=C7QDG9_CATAD|nr:hypothetical protein [Catenulispora acidiphila]ACU72762.1 hypothetical protein Caci_3871 [Catenulispora acidiphila DSM 44928]